MQRYLFQNDMAKRWPLLPAPYFFSCHRVPEGLEDVSKFPDLVAYLIDGGWDEAEIKALLGNNLLRVFEAVEQVSSRGQIEISEGFLYRNIFIPRRFNIFQMVIFPTRKSMGVHCIEWLSPTGHYSDFWFFFFFFFLIFFLFLRVIIPKFFFYSESHYSKRCFFFRTIVIPKGNNSEMWNTKTGLSE